MKKLLPPILFILFAVGMPFVCWGSGSNHYIAYPYNLTGLPFMFLGLGMAAWGKRLFRKLGTNINTFNDPDILIACGLYKITRNPMYLGFVIALVGTAVLFQGAISSFAIALLFLVITDRWYIKYEEKIMRGKFGEEYEVYCRNTRRWI